MKAVLALSFAVMVCACVAADNSDHGAFSSSFAKADLRTWCAQERSDEEVKKEVGAHPLITGSFESVSGSDDLLVDTIRFTYPIEELEDGRCRRIVPMKIDGSSLVFRFRGHRLIEVVIWRGGAERSFEFVWQAEKRSGANKPVEPTSGTRPDDREARRSFTLAVSAAHG